MAAMVGFRLGLAHGHAEIRDERGGQALTMASRTSAGSAGRVLVGDVGCS
jgi:hypothetical protein